jgi:glucose-6-phosphate isomerase, archaeal
VTYARGRLGSEPVRSQGHVHRVSVRSGCSPPELYEIWRGRAIVYMQERAADDPGRCLAVEAGPGEVVVVPPGWAHATVSADPREPMTFGAWCDRDYGFEYAEVRARGGLAWFPLLGPSGGVEWEANPRYASRPLEQRRARAYPELGLVKGEPIYRAFARDANAVSWVADPSGVAHLWGDLDPRGGLP